MVQPTRPPANAFVEKARKIYNPIGFRKGYNFVLFFIFVGALMGFALARFQYLNYDVVFCAPDGAADATGGAPGECYWYTLDHYRIGMIIHLGAIIPASFLVCFQFVPLIRYKLILFHRLNGYLLLLLALLGNVGALMIARHAFGGGLAIQALVGFLAMISIASLGMAYYNIKKLQIEQHRAWMLRAWFYMGSIITLRLIMIIAALIISAEGDYYEAYPCYQIDYIKGRENTLAKYPDCESFYSGKDHNKHVVVNASFSGSGEQIGVALGMSFGMAAWLALALHALGVEIYLRLTPAEFQRLRQISYERQLEAGMKKPGNAGTTIERFGDAEPWVPKAHAEGDGSIRSVDHTTKRTERASNES